MTFVVGTAGHVDHGKSSLVRALTGIEPDRWEEEQRRQLTIDLGFAWLTLPDGREVGIVDVPGHEDFIENMLAGVGGIDVAVLVVAADEGIMPQTREHLSILTLLDIPRLLVAITKVDAVNDDELLQLVQLEVEDLLATTKFGDAPILLLSAHTGAGLDEFLSVLAAAFDELTETRQTNIPHLPIDRVFTLSGFGTVVTGTLLGGVLHSGDEIALQPSGLKGRIRGLQSHEQDIAEALPGNRVAVNITGVSHNEIARGEVLSIPGYIRPTQLIDVTLDYLPDAPKPLMHNAEVKVFAGTSEAVARVRLLTADKLHPGEQAPAQIVLQTPLALLRKQRFIIRRPSPAITIGGGVVLDVAPERKWKRNQPAMLQRFERLQRGTPADLLTQVLLEARRPLHIQKELAALFAQKQMQNEMPLLEELLSQTEEVLRAQASSSYIVHVDVLRQRIERAQVLLSDFHTERPMLPGLPLSQLRQHLQLPDELLDVVLAALEEQGQIIIEAPLVRHVDFEPRLTRQQQAQLETIRAAFAQNPFTPPSVKEVQQLGEPVLLDVLLFSGEVVRISGEVLLARAVYEDWVQYAYQELAAGSSLSVSSFRDAFGTSRKYALTFLEFLNSQQVTRRVQDEHLLGQGDWDMLFNPYMFV
jgi:selenocysteine-specific elongation factor